MTFPDRHTSRHALIACLILAVTATMPAAANAQQNGKPLADIVNSGANLQLSPNVVAERWVLTVSGPEGYQWREVFEGQAPSVSVAALEDGTYSYSLQAIRRDAGPTTQSGTFSVFEGVVGPYEQPNPMPPPEQDPQLNVGRDPAMTPLPIDDPAEDLENGPCTPGTPGCEAGFQGSDIDGAVATPGSNGTTKPFPPGFSPGPTPSPADQQILDDLIVDGSICAGQDCVNGESFGFDTLRLKENNLRIKFQDTSNSASFPTQDWQLTANDSTNGGTNRFSIEAISPTSSIPFTVEADAGTNALYLTNSRAGFGTDTPVADVHIKQGNTPTVRLEQDGTSGFSPQTWDVAGNEANFFIRDVTNGSTLPFRIRLGAPTSALDIAGDGDIGIGTASPDAPLHVFRSNGNSQLHVEETNGTAVFRTLLQLDNNGPVYYSMRDTSTNTVWFQQAHSNRFLITKSGTGDQELELYDDGRFIIGDGGDTNLDLDANGNLEVRGTVTEMSSRISKSNIALADSTSVWNRLMSMPIYEWSYTSDPTVRHMGPMAEDFWQAFGLAGDDSHMSARDLAAVAVAAVQELSRVVQDQQILLAGYRTAIVDMGGDPDAAVAAVAGGDNAPIAGAGVIGPRELGEDPDVSTVDAPRGFEPAEARSTDDVDSSALGALRSAITATDGAYEDPRDVVRVYKNYDAWWGEDRDSATFADLGKSRGYDWFVHDMSEMWTGIPEDTSLAVITSASSGDYLGQITHQSGPVAQAALHTFLQGGGTLLVGLADNDENYGYRVPGADGSPALVLPSDCGGATLANVMYGDDRLAGTADDHPLLMGPDGEGATEDDLTPFDVGLRGGCYVAHGNLSDGFELPDTAQVLMTANFAGVQQPVLAEYPVGEGRVLVTTLTMEYLEHSSSGRGASKFLTNLFSYALHGADGNQDPEGEIIPGKEIR